MVTSMVVGILALQGNFREHEAVLQRIGVQTRQVRLPQHLDQIDRLIIPGGESTTIGKLLTRYQLLEPICQRARREMPVWGTCAGAILMARHMTGGLDNQPSLGLMDIVVQRNAFGRQLESFETELDLPALGAEPLRGIFIRAPRIDSVGSDVEILARLNDDGSVVAAQQQRLMVTTFHPELTPDDRMHRYFLGV
jgi:5'-phosphate synthase pdxT subunit